MKKILKYIMIIIAVIVVIAFDTHGCNALENTAVIKLKVGITVNFLNNERTVGNECCVSAGPVSRIVCNCSFAERSKCKACKILGKVIVVDLTLESDLKKISIKSYYAKCVDRSIARLNSARILHVVKKCCRSARVCTLHNALPRKNEIVSGKRVTVSVGETVVKGDALTDGSKAPADIMRIFDDPNDPASRDYLDKIYEYIIKETQKVYRSQSCNVNDKHIEIIARQMTRKIRISFKGDTDLLVDSLVDMTEFEAENNRIQARIDAGEELALAEGKPILLGITKASLQTESFLSAASFQETTKVLTEAAIHGKVDYLRGLKENVIIGKKIPAGTGTDAVRESTIEIKRRAEEERRIKAERIAQESEEEARLQSLVAAEGDAADTEAASAE